MSVNNFKKVICAGALLFIAMPVLAKSSAQLVFPFEQSIGSVPVPENRKKDQLKPNSLVVCRSPPHNGVKKIILTIKFDNDGKGQMETFFNQPKVISLTRLEPFMLSKRMVVFNPFRAKEEDKIFSIFASPEDEVWKMMWTDKYGMQNGTQYTCRIEK